MIDTIFLILMALISVSLITVILLQKRGSGIGSAFGGSSESYRSKRGVERFLYYITIGIALLFALIPFALLII